MGIWNRIFGNKKTRVYDKEVNYSSITVKSFLREDGALEYEARIESDKLICEAHSLVSFEDALYQLHVVLSIRLLLSNHINRR